MVMLEWSGLSIGAWLSLVEHLVRDQGVGGSNPLAPINESNKLGGSKWPAFFDVHIYVHTGAVWSPIAQSLQFSG
jgi:hypothetical protein